MALRDTDTHHHLNKAPRGANIVLIGFLLQWPTLLTLAMFPVLVVMMSGMTKN